jgi:hypothetical protein
VVVRAADLVGVDARLEQVLEQLVGVDGAALVRVDLFEEAGGVAHFAVVTADSCKRRRGKLRGTDFTARALLRGVALGALAL